MINAENGDIPEEFVARAVRLEYVQEDFDAEGLFLATEATEWIEQHRLPRGGRLDMHMTAESLGLQLEFVNVSHPIEKGSVDGLTKSGPITIKVNNYFGLEEQRLTFGHEVGHIFLFDQIGALHGTPVEDFCEQFGRELAIPSYDLRGQRPIREQDILLFMQHYAVDFEAAVLQLMKAGRLPSQIAIEAPRGNDGMRHVGQLESRVACYECEIAGSPSLTGWEREDTGEEVDFRTLPTLHFREPSIAASFMCRHDTVPYDDHFRNYESD